MTIYNHACAVEVRMLTSQVEVAMIIRSVDDIYSDPFIMASGYKTRIPSFRAYGNIIGESKAGGAHHHGSNNRCLGSSVQESGSGGTRRCLCLSHGYWLVTNQRSSTRNGSTLGCHTRF